MEILEQAGIYFIFVPSLNKGYIGSSINVLKRYQQHLRGSHKKIFNQCKDELEFMILEYLPNYKVADVRKIEKAWIQHYKLKGMELLNNKSPNLTDTVRTGNKISAFNLSGKQVKEFPSQIHLQTEYGLSTYQLRKLLKQKMLLENRLVVVHSKELGKFSLRKLINKAKLSLTRVN